MTKARIGPGYDARATLLPADPARLVRAVEAGGAGLWQWDLVNNVIQVSSRLTDLLGLPLEISQIPAAQLFACVHRDDVPLFRVALSEALKDEQPFIHQFRTNRGNGQEPRWLSYQGRIVERDEDGAALGLAGLCLDVTEQRRTQEAYDLLNRELSHRMKNLLSVVGSLVNMTGEHRPEVQDFVTSFQARLNTFAAAHEFLTWADWQPIPLEDFVEKALAPFGVWSRVDVSTRGKITLGSNDAQTLVLVLHELATNAIKYGALSNGSGRIELSFKPLEPSEENGSALVMNWTESGGPSVAEPADRGFGIRLIERLTKRQVSGEAVLDWRPDGLHCCIELPVRPPPAPQPTPTSAEPQSPIP